ncbi:MAG: hypothetical protein V4610_20010 [Pseudomonadota bacterium]|uniref:Protein activator of alkane oxidation PraB n=1 Tax=hydrothermal vent metagenome TaxID=652676 RepID=A0A160TN56_9ZZZZ
MKFVSAICATALALAGTAAPASAATYSPTSGTFVFQGSVVVKKGLTLNCTLKLTVNVTSSTTATVTPALGTPSNILCPTVTFSGTPYTVTSDGTTVTISGVVVNTITPGGCSGTISGTWGGNSATPRFISVNASLPGGGTSDPCTIVGTLNQVSGSALSIFP